MPAKSSTFSNDILNMVFNGITITGMNSDDPGYLPNLYVSLHTASPGAGNQTTNEATYIGYQRIAVSKAGGWTVGSNSASPTSTIVFPIAVSGTEVESYFAIGTDATGTGKILYFGAISPTISVAAGITPQITSASTITEA